MTGALPAGLGWVSRPRRLRSLGVHACWGGWGALGTGKPPGGGGGPAGDWGIRSPEIPPPPEMVTKRPGH